MFSRYRIHKLQNRILKHGDYDTQIKKSIEELKELLDELNIIDSMKLYDKYISLDVYDFCGNIQKEIEDAGQMIDQLRVIFNSTSMQRKMSRICRQRIVKQMEQYVKERGIK